MGSTIVYQTLFFNSYNKNIKAKLLLTSSYLNHQLRIKDMRTYLGFNYNFTINLEVMDSNAALLRKEKNIEHFQSRQNGFLVIGWSDMLGKAYIEVEYELES